MKRGNETYRRGKNKREDGGRTRKKGMFADIIRKQVPGARREKLNTKLLAAECEIRNTRNVKSKKKRKNVAKEPDVCTGT